MWYVALQHNKENEKMSKTVLDDLRYVLQNMRLQEGQMAKVQADIVAQAIVEIETLDKHIEEMSSGFRDMAYTAETR